MRPSSPGADCKAAVPKTVIMSVADVTHKQRRVGPNPSPQPLHTHTCACMRTSTHTTPHPGPGGDAVERPARVNLDWLYWGLPLERVTPLPTRLPRRYEEFAVRSFVDDQRQLSWCPAPGNYRWLPI